MPEITICLKCGNLWPVDLLTRMKITYCKYCHEPRLRYLGDKGEPTGERFPRGPEYAA
jgi:hypothetical protein